MKIRILLADDHQRMRESLCALIAKQPGMELVAAAQDCCSALELTCSIEPDVVVVDINMADLKGIEVVRRMISDSPGIKIIALSIYSNPEFVEGMLKAGACGYVLKDSAYEELAPAIRSVVADQVYLGSGIAAVQGFAAPGHG